MLTIINKIIMQNKTTILMAFARDIGPMLVDITRHPTEQCPFNKINYELFFEIALKSQGNRYVRIFPNGDVGPEESYEYTPLLLPLLRATWIYSNNHLNNLKNINLEEKIILSKDIFEKMIHEQNFLINNCIYGYTYIDKELNKGYSDFTQEYESKLINLHYRAFLATLALEVLLEYIKQSCGVSITVVGQHTHEVFLNTWKEFTLIYPLL